MTNHPQILLVGCYTQTGNHGINIFELEADQNNFVLLNQINVSNASFFALTPDNKRLYCVNEHGAVTDTIMAINFNIGRSTVLNTTTSGGSSPCYITLANSLKHLFVANYNDGTLYVPAINADGTIAENGQLFKYQGSGPDPRQEASHMHCAVLSPNGQFLLAADLGTDHIYIYAYNADNDASPLQQLETVKLNPGTGPRHILFSADGRFVYIIGEVNATINAFTWVDGKLEAIQVIAMMPAGYSDLKSGAEVRLSADGRFLYASQRGNGNQIVIFSVDKNTGMLKFSGRQHTGGNVPRNFAIDPTGQYLLVAHQKSNDIRVFKIDTANGALTYTGCSITVDMPVYLKFM